MDSVKENRRHKRLPLKLSAVCNRVGIDGGVSILIGETINVSTGGLLVEVGGEELSVGDTLSLRMTLPPSSGLMERGGRMNAHAQVLRVFHKENPQNNKYQRYVAMQFCGVPSFSS